MDGTENPPSNLYSKNMHLVQKYVAVTNHGYLGYAVIVNKKFWDGLPGDVRKLLNDCLEEATRKNNLEADKLNRSALEAVKKSKKTQVIELTDAERAVWRKALEPVYRKMEGRIDRDLINAIRRVGENSQPPLY